MKKISIITLSLLSLLSIALLICSLFVNIIFTYFAFASFCILFVAGVVFLIIRKGKFLNCIAVVLSLLLLVPSSILLFKKEGKNVEFVIHAGGSLESDYYLNCLEGLEYYINEGCNLIELDFLFTSDNEIICSHFFEYYEGYSLDNRPTLEEAQNTLVAGKYTTLTFTKLVEILEENPDVKIVFDTKEDDSQALINQMLEISSNASLDLKSRMIIQVYSYEDYLEMNELQFDEYWFTNYKAGYLPNAINDYFGDCENVTTIVLYEVLWKLYHSINFNTDKNIAVHTVNDKTFINFMKERGVDYVYCDYI